MPAERDRVTDRRELVDDGVDPGAEPRRQQLHARDLAITAIQVRRGQDDDRAEQRRVVRRLGREVEPDGDQDRDQVRDLVGRDRGPHQHPRERERDRPIQVPRDRVVLRLDQDLVEQAMRRAALLGSPDRCAGDRPVRDLRCSVDQARQLRIATRDRGEHRVRVRSRGHQRACICAGCQILNSRAFGHDRGDDAVIREGRVDERSDQPRVDELIGADHEQRTRPAVAPARHLRGILDHQDVDGAHALRDANRALPRRQTGDARLRQRIHRQNERVHPQLGPGQPASYLQKPARERQ